MNDNCLAGMRCPQCGSEEPFRIEVTMLVDVWDNGTQDTGGDLDWARDAYAECLNDECRWYGIADDLYDKPELQP